MKTLSYVLSTVALLLVSGGAYTMWQSRFASPESVILDPLNGAHRIDNKVVTPVTTKLVVTSFEECVAAGNPVMESYPQQCRADRQIFTEFIGNEFEKAGLIRMDTPRPNQVISSPLIITGKARGNWYFEASFPVVLADWDGKIIAQGMAQAKADWMTTDFVPFEAMLVFTADKDAFSNKGSLILKKDNPSGLPKNDDALEVPVLF